MVFSIINTVVIGHKLCFHQLLNKFPISQAFDVCQEFQVQNM